MPGKIAVEVAYALPEKQYLQRVTLQEGATVEEAIRASGLLELRTDIDLTKNKVGIYSRPAKLSDSVHDGDTALEACPSGYLVDVSLSCNCSDVEWVANIKIR